MVLFTLLAACSRTEDPVDRVGHDDPPPPDPTTTVPSPIPVAPAALGRSVVINEFQASNRSTWQSTITWDFPDWVELYNNGTETVALRDLSLVDVSGDAWRGPEKGTLNPGERLFLTSDGDDDDYDLPFSLDAGGGDVLYLALNGAPVDIVPVGEMEDDLSMARFPDGGDWLPTARPTPEQTNGSTPSDTLDPADQLFRRFYLHEIVVSVPRDQYDEIDARIPTESEITIDGIYFARADLKNTGQGSFDTMAGKPRFVFNLDAYDLDREFLGVDNLELHNGKTADCTRARDWVTYTYAGLAGLPASRVGFAHLVINGDDYGLYVLVENQDDKWIEARFPASKDTGMLFEAGDFSGSLSSMEYEAGPTQPDPESVAAMEAADAITSGAATNTAFEQLWNYIEKDHLLNYIAFEGISNHWDGYDSPHNYRWYVDGVTHRTSLVAAGVEISWTGDPELWTSNGNLAEFCFENALCSREYAEHVLTMADLVEDQALADEYEATFNWLRPHINADPRKFQDMATVDGTFNSSLTNLRNNPGEARQEIYDDYPDLMP